MNPNRQTNRIEKKTRNRLIKLLVKIVIIITVIVGLFNYGFCIFYIRGNYMFPAMRDGDLVIATKLEVTTINDVIVYKEDDESRVGRVVATEGDTVSFSSSGELIVNGNVSTEEIFYATTESASLDIEYPYTVPTNSVFVLNDYRSGSDESYSDSRTFEAINKKNIKGKVFLLIRRRGF